MCVQIDPTARTNLMSSNQLSRFPLKCIFKVILTPLSRIEFPILINWTSFIPFKRSVVAQMVKCIWESPPQFEYQLMARVYVMGIARSIMYQKAPFC